MPRRRLFLSTDVSVFVVDCGGVCSCATCHVHAQPEQWDKVGAPSEMESDMLEFDDNVSEHSRLSCQMQVTEALDGVILKVAK